MVVGGSAGLTAAEAAESAFREAFQTLLMASLIARNAGADGAAETFDEHVGRFISADVARRAEFLTASDEIVAASTLPSIEVDGPLDAVRALASRLHDQGVEALAFNLTTVDAAAVRLHVARVFCPELVWLDVDFDYPFDARPRLDAVASARGLPVDADGRAVLNPEPHPFP
jgi:ribosomal protein S12 methylthiotransferase accessory factor YcaO